VQFYMASYRDFMAARNVALHSLQRAPSSPTATNVVLLTLLSSYFTAKASDPTATSSSRTLYSMANGLTNLYVLQILQSNV